MVLGVSPLGGKTIDRLTIAREYGGSGRRSAFWPRPVMLRHAGGRPGIAKLGPERLYRGEVSSAPSALS